jgi:hypothetical protein
MVSNLEERKRKARASVLRGSNPNTISGRLKVKPPKRAAPPLTKTREKQDTFAGILDHTIAADRGAG